MDADQYVSIKIVAGFPKVAQLTNDYTLIVDVLRSNFYYNSTFCFCPTFHILFFICITKQFDFLTFSHMKKHFSQ